MMTTFPIYLDNNATTRPHPAVIDAVAQAMAGAFANPGSRHAAGRKARQALETARETVARVLGAQPEEVIFTSGGTEASNLALFGLSAGSPGAVVLPPGEHPATEETVQTLQTRGWKRITLPLDAAGRLIAAAIDALPWQDVRLATSILAHNETGVIYDLSTLAAHCRAHGVPLHVDALQAAGKIDVNFRSLGATTLSIGAHKFYGPRGIGALLVQRDVRLTPLLCGGHQEQDRRPGTECVALAVGMATALETWEQERAARTVHLTGLRDRLERGLRAACPPIVVNGEHAPRLPNTLNAAFPGCDGDALLVALDLAGVCCSLGSTCASGSSEPAPILVAMGLSPEIYRASLRLSVGIENTEEEIDEAIRRIAHVVRQQRP